MKETNNLHGTQDTNVYAKQLSNTQQASYVQHYWILLFFHSHFIIEHIQNLYNISFPFKATFYLLLNTLYYEQWLCFLIELYLTS